MSKSTDELAAEILIAGLTSNQVKTKNDTTSIQGEEIASAYKKIRDAVASQVPPSP